MDSANNDNRRARLISFYLPQFHPVKENDEWWGKGFTEWTNVTKAKPLFPGHYQPHIPADLGLYDLRLAETRHAQAELAKSYGIEGFCYWHYWFNGKRLLDRPFDEVLQSGKPDFPFCLAWANEPWSRRWTGEESEVLQAQTHSPEDDQRHAEWLIRVFIDKRCIRLNNRPLFLIYRPLHLPEPLRTTEIIRETCIKAGLPEPFLLGMDSHWSDYDFREIGFDSNIIFEPKIGFLPGYNNDGPSFDKLKRNLKQGILSWRLKVFDYEEAVRYLNPRELSYPHFRSIMVSWDNTPRRGAKGVVIRNATPERFGARLDDLVKRVESKPFEERLVFINAWNEWAEGNHLEPDLKYKDGFLQAVRRVVVEGEEHEGDIP